MKREGDIKTVERIEQLIKQTKNHRAIRGNNKGKFQGQEPSAVFTRVYEVFAGEFIFTIQLEFDYRIHRGRVTWQHKENALFQAVPGLRERLLSLRPMSNGWRKTVDLGRGIKTSRPEIPYDIRTLVTLAVGSNNDQWGKNNAIESLASIRDYIDSALQNSKQE